MRPARAVQSVVAAAIVSMLLAGCSGGSERDKADGDVASIDAETTEFPEGVYRADAPAEYLIEKGMDSVTAHNLGGIWTLTIKDGRWRGHTESALNHPDCGDTYGRSRAILADRRRVRREPRGHDRPLEARGRRAHLLRHSSGETTRMGSKPYKKID